jgi:hypothetical protein
MAHRRRDAVSAGSHWGRLERRSIVPPLGSAPPGFKEPLCGKRVSRSTMGGPVSWPSLYSVCRFTPDLRISPASSNCANSRVTAFWLQEFCKQRLHGADGAVM